MFIFLVEMNYLDEEIIISKPEEQLQLVEDQNINISKDNSKDNNLSKYTLSKKRHIILK